PRRVERPAPGGVPPPGHADPHLGHGASVGSRAALRPTGARHTRWMVPSPLPPWPLTPPRHGRVTLREVRESDVAMALDLAADPYVPQTGTLPAAPSPEDALAWVHRQRGRHAEGSGFSFTVVERRTGLAVGHCGLWLRAFPHGSA